MFTSIIVTQLCHTFRYYKSDRTSLMYYHKVNSQHPPPPPPPVIRSECKRILHAAYLASLTIIGPYTSMAKLSIGMSVVVYTMGMQRPLSHRTVFVVIGLYNILRHHVGFLMPRSVQKIIEISVSIKRIQVRCYCYCYCYFNLVEPFHPIQELR